MNTGVLAAAAPAWRASAIAALVLLVWASAACSSEAIGGPRRLQLTGVVVGREASPSRIVVSHDAVSGFMPAMTMAFAIHGEALVPDFAFVDQNGRAMTLRQRAGRVEVIKDISEYFSVASQAEGGFVTHADDGRGRPRCLTRISAATRPEDFL